jgi:tetratricopeptide (TPR) repeat protein
MRLSGATGRAHRPCLSAGVSTLGAAALLLAGLLGCSGPSRAGAAAARSPRAEQRPTAAVEEPDNGAGGPAFSAEAARAHAAGLAAFEQGDLKGAAEQFNHAIAVDSRTYPALVGLGSIQERQGGLEKALQSYDAALAIAPGYGPAVAAKVRALLGAQRVRDAEAFAQSSAAKHPDSAPVLAALAEVMSVRGDSAGAQRLAQTALKKDPDYRPAMVTLARDHYRARRLDLALYTLTAILDGYGQENPPRDKNNADARLLRALIYKEQGKRKAAMEELTQVVSLRPDLVDARLHLAEYMLEAGNATEARPILEKALEYDPSNVLVHLNLGDAYRLLGKPQDALDHLNWVARKDDSLAPTQYNIGLVYLFSTDVPGANEEQAVERAIEAFERFKKLEPHTARGAGDDVDDLLARARNKKAIIEALKAQPQEAPAETPAGTPAEPAAEAPVPSSGEQK